MKANRRFLFVLVTSMTLARAVWGQSALSVGNVPGFPGATVSVPVQLRNVTNATAAQFDLQSNPARVSFGAPLLGERMSNYVIRSREVSPGVHRVVVYSPLNPILTGTNRTLAQLQARLTGNEFGGSGPLQASNVYVARRNGDRVAPLSTRVGAVFARPVNRREDGVVDFFLPSRPDERYLIQATTNFEHWVNLTNTVAFGSFMQLVDTDAPRYPYRFYRSALADFFGTLSGPQFHSNGNVTFRLEGADGRLFTVQSSTNLNDWENLRTAAAGLVTLTNVFDPRFPTRFFRLRSAQ